MKSNIIKITNFKFAIDQDYILGYGHFSTIHTGHIRYLKHAKKQGGKLLIALIGDINEESKSQLPFKQKDRAEALSMIGIVDEIILLEDKELDEVVKLILPKTLILGKEFNDSKDEIIKSSISLQKESGRTVQFHAGEIQYATSDLLQGNERKLETQRRKEFKLACKRQSLNKYDLLNAIKSWGNTQLLVIGDTIIDQYAACEALGMSAEAPVVVVKELRRKNFIGGAAVVASHIKALGAECHLLSITGDDDNAILVRDHLEEKNIGNLLIKDKSRPTTFKKRYVVENQKIFRVSQLEDHSLEASIEAKLIKKIEDLAHKIDGIVVSDFIYGVITNNVLKQIHRIAKKNNLMLFGDLQCSSQVGNITRFQKFSLICPNEREVRIALQDKDSGLEQLSQKLIQKTSSENLIMKLGSNGFIAYEKRSNGNFVSQSFPALSLNPLDVTGAGDSLLALMSTGLSSGSSLMCSAALGCCMASLAVEKMGNTSICADDLVEKLCLVLNS